MTKSEAITVVLNDLEHLTVTGTQNAAILSQCGKNLQIIREMCRQEEAAAAAPADDKKEE